MARQPILPRNLEDPTGQQRRVASAYKDIASRMRVIRRGMLRILDQQQYRVVTLNALELNEEQKTYIFQLDDFVLATIDAEIEALIDGIISDGTAQTNWMLAAYVTPAYQNGTALAYSNISVQSTEYALSKPTLESLLLSDPYRRRLGLTQARVFNEMLGLSDTMKADLANTLTRGMALGQNPRKIADDIRARIGVSESRAQKIAQTEIVGAMRTARREEAADAQERLGIRTMLMHLSALKSTSRASHVARHAKLYTIQEVANWYAIVPNMIFCYCTQVEVLVDKNNQPLTPSIIDRAKAMRR